MGSFCSSELADSSSETKRQHGNPRKNISRTVEVQGKEPAAQEDQGQPSHHQDQRDQGGQHHQQDAQHQMMDDLNADLFTDAIDSGLEDDIDMRTIEEVQKVQIDEGGMYARIYANAC